MLKENVGNRIYTDVNGARKHFTTTQKESNGQMKEKITLDM